MLKIGDVCRIKSGGPRMTVSGVFVPNTGSAWCELVWFTALENMRNARLPTDALRVENSTGSTGEPT